MAATKYRVNKIYGILIPTGAKFEMTKTLTYGEEVEWDGANLTLSDGERMRIPSMAGAIDQGWLVPSEAFQPIQLSKPKKGSKFAYQKNQDVLVDLKEIQKMRQLDDHEEFQYKWTNAAKGVTTNVQQVSASSFESSKPPTRIRKTASSSQNSSYRSSSVEEEVSDIVSSWDKKRSVNNRVQEAVECYGDFPEVIEAICEIEAPKVVSEIRKALAAK